MIIEEFFAEGSTEGEVILKAGVPAIRQAARELASRFGAKNITGVRVGTTGGLPGREPVLPVRQQKTSASFAKPYEDIRPESLDEVLHVLDKWEAAMKKQPPPTAPGAPSPSGQGPLGLQRMKTEAKAAGLPEPQVGKGPIGAPFAHEAELDPRLQVALARTKYPAEQRTTLSDVFSKVKQGAKRLFITTPRLKGEDPVGPRGESRSAWFNQDSDTFRLMKGLDRTEKEEAAAMMRKMLGPKGFLSDKEFDLFTTKLWVDEMLESANRGEVVPLAGVPKKEALTLLGEASSKLQPHLERSPRANAVYRNHLALNRAVGQELVSRGLIDGEKMRDFYMHHVVKEFALAKTDVSGIGLRVPGLKRFFEGKPGRPETGIKRFVAPSLKERSGLSAKDISREYLAVQYEYLYKTMKSVKMYDMMREMALRNDVRMRPLKGYEQFKGRPLDSELNMAELPDYEVYNFDSGFSELRGVTAAEQTFGAAMELSAQDLAKVYGIPDVDIQRLVANLFQQPKQATLPQKAIIPKALAETLREAARHRELMDPGFKVIGGTTQFFKNVVLHKFPFQYNLRNFVGDFQRGLGQFGPEFANVSNKEVYNTWKEAYRDVVDAYAHKRFSPIARDLQELNVTGSGRTAVEVSQFQKLPQFSDVTGTEQSAWKNAKDMSYWFLRKLPRFSSAREDLMRSVVYRMNLKRWSAGKEMLSGIVDIRGFDLSTVEGAKRAAAKIARESLGDYGNFTVAEDRWLRGFMFPFYSWAKINLTFWPKLLNSIRRGTVSPGSAAGAATAATAGAAAKGLGMVLTGTVLLRTWNEMVMGDAERALPDYIQKTNHFIVPDPEVFSKTGQFAPYVKKDEQGRDKIMTVSVPDALDDFLDWLGINGLVPDLKHVLSGRMGWDEYLTRAKESAILYKGIPAPGVARNVVNLLGPAAQAMLMGLSDKKYFPDPLEPMDIMPGEKPAAVAGALGLSGLPLIGGGPGTLEPFRGPQVKGVTEVGEQLGLRSDVAGVEDSFLRESRVRLARLDREINELTGTIGRISAGRQELGLEPKERDERVRLLDRRRQALIEELQKQLRRVQSLEQRRQPLNLGR